MPARRMTPEERKEWLGSGIVLSGIKRPEKSPQPSTDTSKEGNPPPSSSSEKA